MNCERNMDAIKRIALAAHDNKKADLTDWTKLNKHVLIRPELLATGTTLFSSYCLL